MSNELNIKAPDDLLQGRYANMMQVMHAKEEFVLDFMFAHPPMGELVSRLIVSPAHMKRIVLTSTKNNSVRFKKRVNRNY